MKERWIKNEYRRVGRLISSHCSFNLCWKKLKMQFRWCNPTKYGAVCWQKSPIKRETRWSHTVYHLGMYSSGTPDIFLFFKAVSTVLISSLMLARISGVYGSYSSLRSPDRLKLPSFWPSTHSRRSSETFRPKNWTIPLSWENRSLFRSSKWTTWTFFP